MSHKVVELPFLKWDDPDSSWRDSAPCLGVWEVVNYFDGHNQQAAKALCARCPVSDRCLDFAVKNHVTHGIWAGFNAKTEMEKMREHANH